MGRTVASNPVISQSQRRDARAKRAKVTVNKDIPALLAAYPRARRGVDGAEVFGRLDLPIFDEERAGKGSERVSLSNGHGTGENQRSEGGEVSSKVRGAKGKRRKKPVGQQETVRARDESEDDDDDPVSTPSTKIDASVTVQDGKSIPGSNEKVSARSSQTESASALSKRPHVRIRVTDTLDAAHDLLNSLSATRPPSHQNVTPHVTILNMCSPLRPGGGFLTGATSHEESLCMRTTLYSSLREEFYRLPEVGGIYTSDVLAFRGIGEDGEVRDLPKGDRWWCDVVSSGMLRFPDVNDEGGYVHVKDRELVEEKMRNVMRMVEMKTKAKKRGGRGLVLGAWGCGAYGNPVKEVAECWKRVLLEETNDEGRAKKGKSEKTIREAEDLDEERSRWSDMEVVFAIKERKMAMQFAEFLGGDIEVEMDVGMDEDEESSQENEEGNSELQHKIDELEERIAKSKSDMQRTMLAKMLQKLRSTEKYDG